MNPPDVIFLQVEGGTSEWYGDCVTWCRDRINDSDVMYLRSGSVPEQHAAEGRQLIIRLMEDENNPEDAMVDAAYWIKKTLGAKDLYPKSNGS